MTKKVYVRYPFVWVLACMLLAGCGISSDSELPPLEISSAVLIKTMDQSDVALDTSSEWVTFFETHDFEQFDEDYVFLYGVNGLSMKAGYVTKPFMDSFPETGNYSESNTYSVCGDGSYSGSSGRGTCSWHGGVYGTRTLNFKVKVVKVWVCNDNPNFSADHLVDGGGHAFLHSNGCESYGGTLREYSYAKYSFT